MTAIAGFAQVDDDVPVGKGGRQRKVLKESIQAAPVAEASMGRTWYSGMICHDYIGTLR